MLTALAALVDEATDNLEAYDYASPALSNDFELAASWRFVFEEVFGIPFKPIPTSRHLDYRLNLLGAASFMGLANDVTVDWRGRLVLPKP